VIPHYGIWRLIFSGRTITTLSLSPSTATDMVLSDWPSLSTLISPIPSSRAGKKPCEGNRPEDGGSTDIRNVGKLVPVCTALQSRRQPSSYSPPWEPQVILNKREFKTLPPSCKACCHVASFCFMSSPRRLTELFPPRLYLSETQYSVAFHSSYIPYSTSLVIFWNLTTDWLFNISNMSSFR
jgi:hypothetical protein